MSKRIMAALVALLLLLAGCSSGSKNASSSNSSKTATVRVAVVTSTLFAPLYVAQANGYFAKQGVNVELTVVKSGQDAIPLVASGKLDVVVAGFSAGMFSALNSGLKFKVVGSMGQSPGTATDSPSALELSTVAANSGIATVADLKGKKVAVAGGAGSAGGYLLDATLRTAGLTIKDVQAVNLSSGDQPAALKTGSVAAAFSNAPFTTEIESANYGKPLAVPAKGTTSTGVIYGGDFAKSSAAQKFFNGLVLGSHDLQGDRAKNDAILQILATATKQTKDVLAKTPFYQWSPNLAPSTDQLNAMQTCWLNAGLLPYKKAIESGTYLDSSFADTATNVK